MDAELKRVIASLHPLERTVLPILKDNLTLNKIVLETRLREVEAMRALQWLENKGVLKARKELKEVINLDNNGIKYKKQGLPEKIFLKTLEKELGIDEIRERSNLDEEELNISTGILKKRHAIEIKEGKVCITKTGKEMLKNSSVESFLGKLPLNKAELNPEENKIYNELKSRKQIIKINLVKTLYIELTDLGKRLVKEKISVDLVDSLNSKILLEKSWKNKEFRRYDVKINVPRIYFGKRHFVNQALEYIRRIWLDLGFKEMTGNLIQTSFWNFDALFTAQDHPVRDMQDTFFIKTQSKGKLPKRELVNRVKAVHENGWKTKSLGWQYKWQEEEAKKNCLRTHTTVLSAKTIANLKKSDLPAKFFSVGKCFRNETLDWAHLFEFNQTEGIVVDENANFRHLLGYLREFFNKMGFEKVRFRPGFFPYTSPSCEVEVFHPVHQKWIELGGSGIFRPEVVVPLIGRDIPILAWGLGIERIIRDYYDIKDLRDLYKNDLKQLKEIKTWLK